MKEAYRLLATQHGIEWQARRYDRNNPLAADVANQAINHAATAIEAAAMIAVAATGTLPQLGFIHEDASISFCLDIADLYRTDVTIPIAFEAARHYNNKKDIPLERYVRRLSGRRFKEKKLIPSMIDKIKELFYADDRSSNA